MCRLWQGDLKGAEDDIRHAISLNASDALAHRYLSTVLVVTGRTDDAVVSARRALQLDPLSPASGTTVAYRLYYAGQYAEALREFDRALEGAPDYASAWIGKAQTYRALGQPEPARQAVREAGPRAGGRTYVKAYTAYSLALDGDSAGARALLDELHATATTRYVSPFEFALVAAGLGKAEDVARYLDEVREDGSGWAVFVPIERELAPYRRLRLRRQPPAALENRADQLLGHVGRHFVLLALQEGGPPGRHRGPVLPQIAIARRTARDVPLERGVHVARQLAVEILHDEIGELTTGHDGVPSARGVGAGRRPWSRSARSA
jgi:Flp pilus assembly protein TadD